MGYRNTVSIIIDSEALASADTDVKTALQQIFGKTRSNRFYREWIKWNDGDEAVDIIMSFLVNLDENDYGFIRIGEEDCDVEVRGSQRMLLEIQ